MKSGKITHNGNLEIEIGSKCQYQKFCKNNLKNLKKKKESEQKNHMKSCQIAHVGNLEI